MSNAKVSIIVPAFNCAEYIGATLTSLLSQTLTDIQIIVVDDGSTDDTLQIIQKFAESDDRIFVIPQKNSGTASAARNTGLSYASGEYIAFLDADDLYHPDKLQAQLKVFENQPETDIVFCEVSLFEDTIENETARYLGSRNFKEKASSYISKIDENLFRCHDDFYIFMTTDIPSLSTQGIMFRRTLLKQETVWFPTELLVGEDIDLWYRLARGAKIKYIDKVLAYYRQRSDSLTSDEARNQLGFIAANTINLERARDLLTPNQVKRCQRRIAYAEFCLGYHYRSIGEITEARKHYVVSLQWAITRRTIQAYLKILILGITYKLLKK